VSGPDTPYPRPSLSDWALLAIAVAFVVSGAIILPHDRDVGIVTLAFFGPCAALFTAIILRKLRYRRLRAEKAEIVGGVPIRQSRALLLAYSATLTIMGILLVLFGRSYGILFWTIAWMIALIGCALLLVVLFGRLASDYVQFDPEGITFGRRRFLFTVPWDGIAQVSSGSWHDNPAVFMWLRDLDGVHVRPVESRDRAFKQFASNMAWAGAPVVLFPSQYGIDLPLLMIALERYLNEPSARAELARRRLPNYVIEPSSAQT